MSESGVFTYDITLPSPRDRARHALGDIDPLNVLRFDETYDALIAEYGESIGTAKIARALAAQFGRNPSSVSIPGGPSVSWSARVSTWLALANSLEQAVADSIAAGGSSVSFTRTRPGMEPRDRPEFYRPFDWEEW